MANLGFSGLAAPYFQSKATPPGHIRRCNRYLSCDGAQIGPGKGDIFGWATFFRTHKNAVM